VARSRLDKGHKRSRTTPYHIVGESTVVHHSKFGSLCLSWVIHVIPAIAACPVRPKSGHSADARVYEYERAQRSF